MGSHGARVDGPDGGVYAESLFRQDGNDGSPMPDSRATADGAEVVSIIIPTHNRFESTRRALASARDQTYAQVEIVVVDDGSTDGTVPYLRSLGSELAPGAMLRTLFQPNRGASAARNRGLDACAGTFVMFLDSDDVLRPGAVERLLAAMRSRQADVVCGAWRDVHIAEGRVRAGSARSRPEAQDAVAQLLSLDGWSPDFCYLYRAGALEGVRWDDTLRVGQDMDFNLRVLAGGARLARADVTVGSYVHHAGDRVSRGPLARWVRSGLRIVDRAATALLERGELTDARRAAAAESLWLLGSSAATRDRGVYERALRRALELKPDFAPRRFHHRAAVALLGRAVAGVALDVLRRIAPPVWARRRWS